MEGVWFHFLNRSPLVLCRPGLIYSFVVALFTASECVKLAGYAARCVEKVIDRSTPNVRLTSP